MTGTGRAGPRGTLYDLEQHRLAAHGEQTLRNAGALITELLEMALLPGVVADMLRVTRDDLTTAADAKAGGTVER
jgi:hypothetical protein